MKTQATREFEKSRIFLLKFPGDDPKNSSYRTCGLAVGALSNRDSVCETKALPR